MTVHENIYAGLNDHVEQDYEHRDYDEELREGRVPSQLEAAAREASQQKKEAEDVAETTSSQLFAQAVLGENQT